MDVSNSDKHAAHLQRLITTRNGEVPNFALLLGAGASKTSNVDTAVEMIDNWREIMVDAAAPDDVQKWLNDQPWYGHEDEYSMLFEYVYDQPAQRRVYIEECVKDANPTWGYAYLTNLLAHHYFDVVFTTNFDDLINEACYLYSERLRPILAAHDSAIQNIRVTSGRPKIIKLHGDFLYDNIKNTLAELETLEDNTKRKLHQFAQEYGLVVIGYGGRDRSVMDTLDVLLRDSDNYKQGIYWCLRRGEEPSRRLQLLLRRDRVYLVRIDGFDEFLADLQEKTRKPLPKAIAYPFEMARERADLFVKIPPALDLHPVIQEHKNALLTSIAEDTRVLPLTMQASILGSKGLVNDAILLWKKAFEQEPQDSGLAHRYADALALAERYEDLGEFLKGAPFTPDDAIFFYLRALRNEDVISLASKVLEADSRGWYSTTENPLSYVRLNRAIALKRLGRSQDMEADLDFLEANGDMRKDNLRAGVAALRGNKDEMFEALRRCLYVTISPEHLKTFPVFEDFQDDGDFLAFVASAERGIVDRMGPGLQVSKIEEVKPIEGPDY